jgi:hypothetical protein
VVWCGDTRSSKRTIWEGSGRVDIDQQGKKARNVLLRQKYDAELAKKKKSREVMTGDAKKILEDVKRKNGNNVREYEKNAMKVRGFFL